MAMKNVNKKFAFRYHGQAQFCSSCEINGKQKLALTVKARVSVLTSSSTYPLTVSILFAELGRNQAEITGERIKDLLGGKISHFYISTYPRAMETGHIILKHLDKGLQSCDLSLISHDNFLVLILYLLFLTRGLVPQMTIGASWSPSKFYIWLYLNGLQMTRDSLLNTSNL